MPVWAYAAIGGGMVAILWYMKKRKAAAPTAAPVDTSGSAGYTNTGGYDYSPTDSFLQSLQGSLANIQGSGVQLNPTGTGQVQQVVATQPVTLASSQPVAPVQGNAAAQQFVTAQYQSILGRSPDQAGLTYWTNYYQQNPGAEPSAFLAAAKQENRSA
jgi:Domain of unknown function (DUF4214)